MFVVKTNGVFVSLCLRHALLMSMFAAIVVELRWNSCWCYTITQESALNDSRTRIIQNICQIDLDSLFLSTYEPDALFSVCVCCLIPHGMHFWHCSNSITVTIIDFIQCCPLKLSHCQLHLGISKSVDFNLILQTFYRPNKSHFTLVWLIPHKLSLCLWRWLTMRGDWVWRLSGCTRSEQ